MMQNLQKTLNHFRTIGPILRDPPTAPILKTALPGPKQQTLLTELEKFSQDYRTVGVT